MSEFNSTGCSVLFQGGIADGERQASAALIAAGFSSGTPLVWSANGWVIADNSAGIFINVVGVGLDDINNQSPMVEGTQQSGQRPCLPVWIGTNMFLMEGSKVNNILTYPFLQTPTGGAWTEGDSVFINAAGKWDDTSTGGSSFGEVVEVVGPAATATGLRVIIRQ